MVSDGFCGEDLLRLGDTTETACENDRLAVDVVVPVNGSACSHPDPDPDSGTRLGNKGIEPFGDRHCALDCVCRTVEGSKDAIAGVLDLPAVMSVERLSNDAVVGPQNLHEGVFPHGIEDLGRRDKIREEDGS